MNYPAVLVWATVCTIIIFFFLLSFQKADSYDYFKSNMLGSGFTDKPIFCIYDPPSKYYIIKAVKSWEIELRKYSDLYDYRIMVDPKNTSCDVDISFINDVIKLKDSNAIGVAYCNTRADDRYCRVQVFWDYDKGQYGYSTLQHEIGHALGLGHRLPIDNKNLAGLTAIITSDEIMYTQSSPFDRITKDSLDAIQFMYNYSGWNVGIDQNYTTPHLKE